MNLELLERGERETPIFLESLTRQLTQKIYELIKTKSLTADTLQQISDKYDGVVAENKLLFLQRQYYVDDEGNVRDGRNNDKIYCEPKHVYDMVMATHLMNKHLRVKHYIPFYFLILPILVMPSSIGSSNFVQNVIKRAKLNH